MNNDSNKVKYVSIASVIGDGMDDTVYASDLDINKEFFNSIGDEYIRKEIVYRFNQMVYEKLLEYYNATMVEQVPRDVPLELVSVFGDDNLSDIHDLVYRRISADTLIPASTLSKGPNGHGSIRPTALIRPEGTERDPLGSLLGIVPSRMFVSFESMAVETLDASFNVINATAVPFKLWLKSSSTNKPLLSYGKTHHDINLAVTKAIWGSIDNLPSEDLNIIETVPTTLGGLVKYAVEAYKVDKGAVDLVREHRKDTTLKVTDYETTYGNWVDIQNVEMQIKHILSTQGRWMSGYTGPSVERMDIFALETQLTDPNSTYLQNMSELANTPCIMMLYTCIDQESLCTFSPRIYSYVADTLQTDMARNLDGRALDKARIVETIFKAYHVAGYDPFKVYYHTGTTTPIEIRSEYTEEGMARVEITTATPEADMGNLPAITNTVVIPLEDVDKLASYGVSLNDDPNSCVKHVVGENVLTKKALENEIADLKETVKTFEDENKYLTKTHDEELKDLEKKHKEMMDDLKRRHQLKMDTLQNTEATKELKVASKVIVGDELKSLVDDDYVGLEEAGITVPKSVKEARRIQGKRYFKSAEYIKGQVEKTERSPAAKFIHEQHGFNSKVPGYMSQLVLRQQQAEDAMAQEQLKHKLKMEEMGNKAKYDLGSKLTVMGVEEEFRMKHEKFLKKEEKKARKWKKKQEKRLRKWKAKQSMLAMIEKQEGDDRKYKQSVVLEGRRASERRSERNEDRRLKETEMQLRSYYRQRDDDLERMKSIGKSAASVGLLFTGASRAAPVLDLMKGVFALKI